MKIAFYSIYLNHHQAVLADELFSLLNEDYVFVELEKCSDNKGSLEDFSKRPYLIKAWESLQSWEKALNVARSFDVCVFGGNLADPFLEERMKAGLLSFDMGERPLKRGLLNLLSPRLLKSQWYYHTRYFNKPYFRLCCSAYAPNDLFFLHTFKGKCFKWGYFTKVDKDSSFEIPKHDITTSEITQIMWCARFLRWKHPELPVQLAQSLKVKGYKFHIDMYGNGEELGATKALIKDLDVEEYVSLKGALPNDKILEEMRNHPIFLFTSDRNEGWGAVLNEAMVSGCAAVASDSTGAAPYLIKDKINGMLFKSGNIIDLIDKVSFLIDNPNECSNIRKQAYETMRGLWSARSAALRFIELCNGLLSNPNDLRLPESGPCSKAVPQE